MKSYRDISKIINKNDYSITHSSIRNYTLKIIKKFAKKILNNQNIKYSNNQLTKICKSTHFQNTIGELIKSMPIEPSPASLDTLLARRRQSLEDFCKERNLKNLEQVIEFLKQNSIEVPNNIEQKLKETKILNVPKKEQESNLDKKHSSRKTKSVKIGSSRI